MRYVFVVLIVLATTPVHALTITGAKIDKGAVQVKGKGAVPFAPITWEGAGATMATKSGAFKFATDVLPTDCTGDVSDGQARVGAVITGCTRGGAAPTFVDANGRVLGIYAAEHDRLANVLRVVNGATVSLMVTQTSGLRGGSRLYYPQGGCLGLPILGGPAAGLFIGGTSIAIVDGTLYYPIGPAPAQSLASYRDPADPNTCRDIPPTGSGNSSTVGTDDVSGFVPPFRVELR